MPSRKGKGRQSLGFGRKSQRAQFHHEWQSRLDEDYYSQRRQEQRRIQKQQRERHEHQLKLQNAKTTSSKGLQNSLRRLIAERQYWDRVEDRHWIYSQHSRFITSTNGNSSNRRLVQSQSQPPQPTNSHTTNTTITPPGWLIFHTTQKERDMEAPAHTTFAREFLCPNDYGDSYAGHDNHNNHNTRQRSVVAVPTLQALSLRILAQALPEYLEVLGKEQLHHDLALLTGPALTVLSVLVSQSNTMTNDLCYVLSRHASLTRLSIVGPSTTKNCDEEDDDDETDPSVPTIWQPNVALELLLPQVTTQLEQPQHVPDSWEELLLEEEEEEDKEEKDTEHGYHYGYTTLTTSNTTCSWKGCGQLERLELGRMPRLDVQVLQQVLTMCGRSKNLTHLGLAGSLTYDRGPDVLWQLSEWLPQLQVLDVSGNPTWVTEPLLRNVYDSYFVLRQQQQQQQGSNSSSHSAEESWQQSQQQSQQQDGSRQQQQQQLTSRSTTPPAPLVIKATGCLTRSSQILMEMEYGTLF